MEAEAPAVADPIDEKREDIEGDDADIGEVKDPMEEPNLSCNFCWSFCCSICCIEVEYALAVAVDPKNASG